MNRTPNHFLSAAASDPALGKLCDEIIERLQAGDGVDVASLALEHPEHADQLRRLLPALEALVHLGTSSTQHPSRVASKQGTSNLAPKVIGDYRILREIGRGGMGVVYEAEQRSLNRRVALKVLPMAAALDTRQFQRFQLEAQAAACLHHNNIVPVFAVGTEGGVPFYAMQYIEGRSLSEVIHELRRAEGLDLEPLAPEAGVEARLADLSTTAVARSLVSGQAAAPEADAPGPYSPTEAYRPNATPAPGPGEARNGGGPDADANPAIRVATKSGSSTRTRDYCRNIAGLGLQAAEALDHAHTRGILHRDIKPANLLLDAEGRLWVTDFGLAQIQGNHGLTFSGDILGTLRYMSPEQAFARRVVIDGRTDIYSLGVTLYELLTLQPAFDGKNRVEILRKIESDDPTPLRKLNASVPQDLETIIHKALAKEPAERYATAKELADDMRNYLESRPIRARRPSLLDRAAKWGRRHTASVAAASVILVLAMIGLATSTILVAREQRRTASALEQADARFRFARKAVDEMYTQVAKRWLADQPTLTKLQREFLEKALAFYEQFAAVRAGEPEIRLAAAKASKEVGEIRAALGKFDESVAAHRQAIAQCEDLANCLSNEPLYRHELSSCLLRFGVVQRRRGRYDEAEPAFRRAFGLWEDLSNQYPENVEYQQCLAGAHQVLGNIMHSMGRDVEAERLLERGMELFESVLKKDAGSVLARSDDSAVYVRGDCAITAVTLGIVLMQMNRFQEAEQAYLRSVELLESLLAEAPTPRDRHSLAGTLINLASLHGITGRFEDAIASEQRAESLLESLVNGFPDFIGYQSSLLVCRVNRSLSLIRAGRYLEAAQVGRRGVELGENLARNHPSVPEHRGELTKILCVLADLESCSPDGRSRDPAQALKLARRALELSPTDSLAWQSLGFAQYRAGDWKGCVEAFKRQTSPDKCFLAVTAMAYWQLGDTPQARTWFERADQWLIGYEEHWKQHHAYPTPAMLRRIRAEAASLLGIKEPDSERTSKPTPKTGTGSK